MWESSFDKPFYIWITPATSTHTFTMECNSLSNQEQEKCVTWNTPPVHSPIRAQKCVSQSSNNTTLIVLPVNLTWGRRHHLQSTLTSWGGRDAVVPRTSKTAMINNISGSHEPTNWRAVGLTHCLTLFKCLWRHTVPWPRPLLHVILFNISVISLFCESKFTLVC